MTGRQQITGKNTIKIMNELRTEILGNKQKIIFEELKGLAFLKDFYLAGGTGLALQIGHRMSEDFDFFTESDFDTLQLEKKISKNFSFSKISEDENTLYGIIEEVKVSFIGFKYKMISPFIDNGNIKIAGIEDIASMKLSAVTQRSTKKDFIDIFYILKKYSLPEIFSFYEKKFDVKEYEYVLRKSLVYFDDADEDAMPRVFEKCDWEEVKGEILRAVLEL